MCYSAIVEADIKALTQTEKVVVDLESFEKLFEMRLTQKVDVPKALETNFNVPRNPQEQRIRELIETYRAQKADEHNAGIVKQTERLAAVEAKLAKKESASALNERRIAANKLSWHKHKLEELVRVERKENDSRIYPQWYAPVIVLEGNQRILRPMRYLCRPEDKPAVFFVKGRPVTFEQNFSGCYNARRDNLEAFWKSQFGVRHAYVVITSFFENVELHKYERRELAEGEESKNLVIHFNPQPRQLMRMACIWSRVDMDGKPIDTFAAVTDEPTPDVAAAGHDRGLIPLTDQALEVWLRPDKANFKALYDAFDNRVTPRYEYQEAA